jgi:hypothetical protein
VAQVAGDLTFVEEAGAWSERVGPLLGLLSPGAK